MRAASYSRTMYRSAVFSLVLIFLSVLTSTTGAAAVASSSIHPSKVTAPFALDAGLADPRWSQATRVRNFTDAVTRTAPRSPTEAAMYYDDRNIYVAFWCRQDAPITATQTTNNIGFGSDDFVGIGIDPSGNADRAYYFEITPAGTRFQQSIENTRYQPQWDGRAHLGNGEWTAMLVIPLSAMKLASGSAQTWRINFVRGVIRTGEKQTWSFSGQMDTGNGFPALADARYWETAGGIEIPRSATIPRPSVDVYALTSGGAGRSEFVTRGGTAFTQNPRTAGVDMTYPITSTISFVGTLNPDFSNVDADQLTITPQIFQRNLVEYRPFFAQGANYINNSATALGINEPPNILFYSPSIGTFDRGAKVEGTYGKYQSLGLLEARGSDDITGEPFDDMAFGWKHVLPGRTFGYWTNGVIANHGSVHDESVEMGIQARDLRTGWVGALFHEGENTTTPVASYKASSTYGFIDHQNANHEGLIAFKNIGPQFNPIDGFTLIGDIRGLGFSYGMFGAGPPKTNIRDGNIYVYGDRYFDGSGAIHKADAGIDVFGNFKADYYLTFGSHQTEVRSYDGNFYSGYPLYINPKDQRFDVNYAGFGLHQSSPSPVNFQYSWGAFGDYYLTQVTSNGARALNRRMSLSWEYDGTRERFYAGGADGQWLRRLGLSYSFDANTSMSIGLRNISGEGGFASPGTNFSGTLHRIYRNGNEFYASFGTPAATKTINRFLFKYVFRSNSQQR
jgi:hypothetical protein